MLTTRAALRQFLLERQGLLGERLSGGTGSAVAWVRRQGFLPLDLRAHALVPSHDIVLLDRVSDYHAGDLDMALYDGTQLFEHCLHVPGALSAGDYALIYDPGKAAAASRPGSIGSLICEFLATEGPAALREVQAHLRRLGNGGRRAVARAVHDLYSSGAILIRHREGSQEFYDLAERVLPLARPEALPVEERLRALARRAFHVLAPVVRANWCQVLSAIGSRSRLDLVAMKREKSRLVAEMLAEGEAAQVRVEDPPEWYLLPATWLPALERRQAFASPRVSFLSPLDPVVWDRRRARDLFGFDWRQQAYVPTAERRPSAANALPILYGQALVGRFEPQMSWSSERLIVHGVQLDDQSLLEDQHFRTAFTTAVRELAAFHEAREVEAAGVLPPRLIL